MGRIRELAAVLAQTREPFKMRLPNSIALSRSRLAIGSVGKASRREEPLNVVQGRLAQAAQEGRTSDLVQRDLRRTGDAIWDGAAPLAASRPVLTALLAEIERRSARSAVFRVVGAYLTRFSKDLPALDLVASFLRRGVGAHDWLWRKRSEDYALFAPNDGPVKVAAAILGSNELPVRVLSDCGLEQTGDTSNFAEAAFVAACVSVRTSRSAGIEAAQKRLMVWGEKGGAAGEAQLIYPKAWDHLADALFLPWEDREPSDDHKRLLVDFAISVAGDPRLVDPRASLRLKRAAWSSETKRTQTILRRWLIRAAFRQFFDFVDAVAEPLPWAYRRAFWNSYLEANYVSDAWVVFGAHSARLAEDAARSTKDSSLLQFGTVRRGGGRGPRQSALLLRIGTLVIADWSHSGKYNIWDSSNPSSPKFYLKEYDADSLNFAPLSGSHWGPMELRWQHRVADEVFSRTRLRTPEQNWKPRRR
ncbi:hypothetical protein sos41_02520 [Alphaproteobacteria bacterium SO-S41]|nr:hypothetical protein sos41_02520 [Alphaproteobacteria bacterium SO-S41]